jgi:peptidoglycan/xylan/chitin deacetylase (PgdA/CDA1 family)
MPAFRGREAGAVRPIECSASRRAGQWGETAARMRRTTASVMAALLWFMVAAAACGSPPRMASTAVPLADAASRHAAIPAPGAVVQAPALVPGPPPPAIPILMYHVIAAPPPHAAYAGLYVSPQLFAAQMAALRQDGYQAITLQQAYDIWHGHAPAPARPVVLSFDDGYAGVFENAVPLLKAYGWPAVLNLQVGRLNVPGGLTTDQVRQMIADGWEVDDHTVTHPDLALLPASRLQREIVGAAETIRQTFGVPVRFFCYPAGDYDAAVVAAVKAAGFLGATTVWPGLADPAVDGDFTLARVRVSGGESASALLATLSSLARGKPVPPPAAYPPPAPKPAAKAPAATVSASKPAAGTMTLHGATGSATATAQPAASAGSAAVKGGGR